MPKSQRECERSSSRCPVSSELLGLRARTDADRKGLLIHDEKTPDTILGSILDDMRYPDLPVPVGVFRAIEAPTYETLMHDQIVADTQKRGEGDLNALFRQGDIWTVK